VKKKSLFLFLVVAIVVLGYLYTRPPETVLSIGQVYGATKVGQTVLVNVTLTDVSTCSGWLINLLWDPYYVTLTPRVPPSAGALPYDVIEGPFLKDAGPTRKLVFDLVDDANGHMIVGNQFAQSGYSASGTGVIIEMNFTVVHVGTTTLLSAPISAAENQSVIVDASNHLINHGEIMGLITDKPAPSFWEGMEFQDTLIAGDVLVLLAATGIVYQRLHPRPPKSQRRKAELQPIFEPKDDGESG
jgi:hypothetical protein